MNEFEIRRNSFPSLFKISFSLVTLNFIVNFIFYKILFNKVTNKVDQNLFGDSLFEEFALVVVLAPILETILFQFLPAYFFTKRIGRIGVILLSSFLFGISHFYNFSYMIFGIIIGLMFILGYYYSDKKNVNPILCVFFAHFTYNIIAFFLNHHL